MLWVSISICGDPLLPKCRPGCRDVVQAQRWTSDPSDAFQQPILNVYGYFSRAARLWSSRGWSPSHLPAARRRFGARVIPMASHVPSHWARTSCPVVGMTWPWCWVMFFERCGRCRVSHRWLAHDATPASPAERSDKGQGGLSSAGEQPCLGVVARDPVGRWTRRRLVCRWVTGLRRGLPPLLAA